MQRQSSGRRFSEAGLDLLMERIEAMKLSPEEKKKLIAEVEEALKASGKGQFKVGKHGDMPSPRGGTESHHGVMSRWMEGNFTNYNAKNAPAVLMDIEKHNATRRAFNAWRNERGGKVDWSISEAGIRQLSERLFNAAEVPANVRAEYYKQFESFLKTLQKK